MYWLIDQLTSQCPVFSTRSHPHVISECQEPFGCDTRPSLQDNIIFVYILILKQVVGVVCENQYRGSGLLVSLSFKHHSEKSSLAGIVMHKDLIMEGMSY